MHNNTENQPLKLHFTSCIKAMYFNLGRKSISHPHSTQNSDLEDASVVSPKLDSSFRTTSQQIFLCLLRQKPIFADNHNSSCLNAHRESALEHAQAFNSNVSLRSVKLVRGEYFEA